MNRYDRHSVASLGEVIGLIQGMIANGRGRSKGFVNGEKVSLTSLRLRTFAEPDGLVCHSCGMLATHFAVERNLHDVEHKRGYHLNLYGQNGQGQEVLFTHDHTIARAIAKLIGKEDANTTNNTKTMCSPCNNRKARDEAIRVQELRNASS